MPLCADRTCNSRPGLALAPVGHSIQARRRGGPGRLPLCTAPSVRSHGPPRVLAWVGGRCRARLISASHGASHPVWLPPRLDVLPQMPRSADQLREQLYFLHPVAEIATQFLIGSARGLCVAGAGAASYEVRAASGCPLCCRGAWGRGLAPPTACSPRSTSTSSSSAKYRCRVSAAHRRAEGTSLCTLPCVPSPACLRSGVF